MLDKKIDVTLQQYIRNLITKNKNIFQKNAYLQENRITQQIQKLFMSTLQIQLVKG